MTILLIAATEAEIVPFLAYLNENWEQECAGSFRKGEQKAEILITGVGMLATSYALTKRLSAGGTYDLVLQAGIGGSYDRSLPLGSMVLVDSEQMGDLGAEDHYQFRDVFELGLSGRNAFPFSSGKLSNPMTDIAAGIELPRVGGLTINSVTGSSFTAEWRWEKYGCTMESMEGAALHYICLMEGVDFAQVRSISNYVEARNREAWEIGKAIKALNDWLIEFVSSKG